MRERERGKGKVMKMLKNLIEGKRSGSDKITDEFLEKKKENYLKRLFNLSLETTKFWRTFSFSYILKVYKGKRDTSEV